MNKVELGYILQFYFSGILTTIDFTRYLRTINVVEK